MNAAKMARHADAASQIIANAQRRAAGCDDRGLATAGTATGPPQIPGIVRAAINRIVRLVPDHELWDVRLAKHHGAGPPHASYGETVSFDHLAILRTIEPDRRWRAGYVEAFFDCDRHAMQRSQRLAASLAGIRRGCFPQCLLVQWYEDGVES